MVQAVRITTRRIDEMGSSNDYLSVTSMHVPEYMSRKIQLLDPVEQLRTSGVTTYGILVKDSFRRAMRH